MIRVFGSPHRYVQGPGALTQLGQWTDRTGGRPVLIIDHAIVDLIMPTLQAAYEGRPLPPIIAFEGEITFAAIAKLTETARPHAPSAIVGVGGGKALDVAKGVAHTLACPMITVPTIASTDAPTSKAIAVYDDQHRMVAVEQMQRNPELVLVDTNLIAKAPSRFLRAGIGDAIAKKFEAEASRNAGGKTAHGALPSLAGMLLAEGCYVTLREHAVAALQAVEAGSPDAALERVVEACVLLAGLGFENSGLSIAHAMTRGLMAAPSTTRALHGDHVAYGLLVQLVLEGRDPAFLTDLIGFYHSVGLPATLRALGGNDLASDELALIADRSMTAPHVKNMPVTVTSATMIAAMTTLERRHD